MKRILSSVIFLVLCVLTFSSSAQITFSKEYGGLYNEEGRWMEQMPDSGYIMTGMTDTYSNGQADVWLVRADAYGNTLWSKNYGGTQWDYGNMVRNTRDHGFIITGFTTSYGAGHEDGWLIKTNGNGIMQWNKMFGDTGDQELNAVVQTTDGGYVAVGLSNGRFTQYYDILLVKVDSAGNTQWTKNIGGPAYDRGNAIQQTADGGYIITGQTYSYGNFDGDYYLVKTNSLGVVQWQKTYGYAGIEEAHYLQITPDGGFAIVGDADSLPNRFGDTDMWLVRTNSNGDTLWTHNYGGNKRDGGKTVENTRDGGFIMAGITRSFGLNDPNFYIVKTDSAGVVDWTNSSYGTAFHDHAYRALQTSDGGYAEFGFYRNAASYENFALVKLGSNGGVSKDLAVDNFKAPLLTLCRSSQVPISITLTNYGNNTEFDIPVILEISNTGGTTILHDTLFGALLPSTSTVLTFHTTFDFTTIGNYTLNAYIMHRQDDISYSNDTNIITILVLPPTGDPVTISATSCTPSALVLRATPAASDDSLFWYDSPAGGNMVSSGFSYTTPVLNSDSTYYVEAVKGKGNQVGPLSYSMGTFISSNTGYLKFDSRKPFKLIAVTVFATSSGLRTIQLRENSGYVLQSKTVNLPVGQSRVYLNFDVPLENDLQLGLDSSSGPLIRNGSGVTFPYSVQYTVEINNSSTGPDYYYYFYDWYIFVPYENCGSNRVPVHAFVSTAATTAFNGSRCGHGSVVLTASSTQTLKWYSAPTGGTLLLTGSTYTTPSLNSTATYYLQVGTCVGRIPVQAIINTVSTSPVTSNVTRCGPGSITLNATAADSVYWYDAPAGGNLMGTGNSYSTNYLNATTVYYAIAGSVCPSPAVVVSAIVNSAAPPVVTPASACGPASVVLNASCIDPVAWFDVPIGGTALDTTFNFVTPVLSLSGTYYAQALSPCLSTRVPVIAEITMVSPPVVTNASICGQGSAVLSAASIDSVSWWSDSTGGSLISLGINYTTPVINGTTTYYAQAVHNGCPSIRVPVTADVIITPPPQVFPGQICGPGSVLLTALSTDSISWYNLSSGGSMLGTGSIFTTPVINATTIFYASSGLACPSVRVPVNAVIATTAATPVLTGSSQCGPGSLMLSTSSTDSITWYDAPGGMVIGTGNVFYTPIISYSTTFYATAGIPGCESNPEPVIAEILQLPTDPIPVNAGSCGPGLVVLEAVSLDSLTWYDAPTGGNIVATGLQLQNFFSTTTTYYVEAFDNHCYSNRVPVTASVWPLPVTNIGPDTLNISSGQSVSLDAGSGFSAYLWNTAATTQLINVSIAGTYSVIVTDANNCKTSDSIVINVFTGVQHINQNSATVIYPNPSQGIITITVLNQDIPFEIMITDVLGREIFFEKQVAISNYQHTFDLSHQAKGVYYLRISSRNGSNIQPLIIN